MTCFGYEQGPIRPPSEAGSLPRSEVNHRVGGTGSALRALEKSGRVRVEDALRVGREGCLVVVRQLDQELAELEHLGQRPRTVAGASREAPELRMESSQIC